jgi:hypothetical protein
MGEQVAKDREAERKAQKKISPSSKKNADAAQGA